jgi:hypothetical protein
MLKTLLKLVKETKVEIVLEELVVLVQVVLVELVVLHTH